MNAKVPPFAALGLCLALAACSTGPEYPMSYQVPLGPAQVTSAYGPINLSVNGTQDVPAVAGQQLYFQVLSPTPIVLYAFDKDGTTPGATLSQMQGTSFYTSVVPTGDDVQFVISAAQPVTGGSVQLTVSDRPMTSGPNAIPYSNPTGAAGATAQPPVTLSPTQVSIAVGQSVTFTVSGGAGSGNYVWGGAATATGMSNVYTFNAPGNYTVTAYRAGDGSYAQSNTAVATVNVSAAPAYQPGSNPAVTVQPAQ